MGKKDFDRKVWDLAKHISETKKMIDALADNMGVYLEHSHCEDCTCYDDCDDNECIVDDCEDGWDMYELDMDDDEFDDMMVKLSESLGKDPHNSKDLTSLLEYMDTLEGFRDIVRNSFAQLIYETLLCELESGFDKNFKSEDCVSRDDVECGIDIAIVAFESLCDRLNIPLELPK